MVLDVLSAGIFSFAFTALLIELTPGPNMAYLAILSANSGRTAGFFATAGIALGFLLIGLLASIGLIEFIHTSPLLYQGIRWAGIGYLFWLAWEGWRDSARPYESTRLDVPLFKYFSRGFITNVLNPKAGIFFLSVIPNFVEDKTDLLHETIALTFIYVIIATLIHLTIVSMASRSAKFLDSVQRRKLFGRVLSGLLALVACWFAWATQ